MVTTVDEKVQATIPTEYGKFKMIYFSNNKDNEEHLALVLGEVSSSEPVLARIHSECITSEVFGSLRCDCRQQLQDAMRIIGEKGAGLVIYLRQEGRGIGLLNKLHAYNLQEQGINTFEADYQLGFSGDERRYDIAVAILKHLAVQRVILMTNNPAKKDALVENGIEVHRIETMPATITEYNHSYLQAKVEIDNHHVDLILFNNDSDE